MLFLEPFSIPNDCFYVLIIFQFTPFPCRIAYQFYIKYCRQGWYEFLLKRTIFFGFMVTSPTTLSFANWKHSRIGFSVDSQRHWPNLDGCRQKNHPHNLIVLSQPLQQYRVVCRVRIWTRKQMCFQNSAFPLLSMWINYMFFTKLHLSL
jgi:hypothetical protein